MNWLKKMKKAMKLLKEIEKQIVRKPNITPESLMPRPVNLRHPQCEIPEEILKRISPVPDDLLSFGTTDNSVDGGDKQHQRDEQQGNQDKEEGA
jgi:hypothetical protein